jgi:DNA-binding CsgD family transcriptional regulator
MDSIEREIGLLAEMALGARDLHEFELDWLEQLRRSIGFETACSVWTNHQGVTLQAATLGYPEMTLRQRFSLYMGELSRDEVSGFSGGKPAIDTEVVSTRRREELTVYRELLLPSRVACFVTQVWHSRWGVFGYHLARCRGASSFTSRHVDRLERLGAGLKLGQALLAADQLRASPEQDWWTQAWGLSRRECDMARLAARGLSNPEIAGVLRVSPLTVRNHLASVFRKAAVSSRTELVFAMNAPLRLGMDGERERRSRSAAWNAFLEHGPPLRDF